MKHTLDFTAPDAWPLTSTHPETLVLDKVMHWMTLNRAHRAHMMFREDLPEITGIALATDQGRVWVYAAEKAEDFGRRYEEAMSDEQIVIGDDVHVCPGPALGIPCHQCDPPEREPKPELPRYLLVNIDKHQGDVTATAELSPNLLEDCAASLTLIIDTKGQAATLGSSHWRAIQTRGGKAE